MLVRCFRAHTMPLERVGTTAEHKVLEALAELHCNASSSSSSGGGGGGDGGGLSVGVLAQPPPAAAACSSGSSGSSSSSGGMWCMGQSFDPWWAAMDSSGSGLSVESSNNSSSSLSVSSSSSSSDASAAELFAEVDLECVLQSSSSTSSFQDLMTSSSSGSRIAAGSRTCAGHIADRGRQPVLLCTSRQALPQQQQQQQPVEQQKQQVPLLPLLRHRAQPAAAAAAAATTAASGAHAPSKHQSALPWWGWSWAFCRSSLSSTDSSCSTSSTTSNNSSSSSSSSAGGRSSLSSRHNRAPMEGPSPIRHNSTAQQLAEVVSMSSSSSSSSSSLWYEAGVAAAADVGCLHPAVQAYLQGSLGIAFSGGGFRYTYFVGVMDVLLHKLGLICPRALLSGASSGSLIAVFTKCGLPVDKVLQLTMEFSQDCASKGVRGRLGVVLRAYLDAYLPDNAHELCDGSTFLAVTRVWPTIRTRLFSSFPTRIDLINAVLASCHLPALSDGSLTMKFKGQLHIDGGLLSVVTPPPHAAHTVLVCSMPSRQIAKLPALITRPHQSLISISPDTYQHWPFTRKQTTALALEPPNPDFIHHMVERGRSDAMAWAEAVGFTRNGQPLFPTAQHLEAVRQQLFDPTGWLTPGGGPPAQISPAAAAAAAAVSAQHYRDDPLLLVSQKGSVPALYQN